MRFVLGAVPFIFIVRAMRVVVAVMVLSNLAAGVSGSDRFIPPMATLGCDGTDLNAVTVHCDGTPPYNRMSCTFIRLVVTKKSADASKKDHAEFLAASKDQTGEQRDAMIKGACADLQKAPVIDFAAEPAPVQRARGRGLQYLKSICDCKGKDSDCLARTLMSNVDAEDRACTLITVTDHDVFKKVSENRWVYTESLPVGCVAASTQVLEREPGENFLWTYKLNEIPAQPAEAAKLDPLCRNFKGTNQVCSWRHPTAGLLDCEEVRLQ